MQAYFDQLDRVRYEGSKILKPVSIPSLQSRRTGVGQAYGRALAICRLLLAHLLLERGGHVWCGGV